MPSASVRCVTAGPSFGVNAERMTAPRQPYHGCSAPVLLERDYQLGFTDDMVGSPRCYLLTIVLLSDVLGCTHSRRPTTDSRNWSRDLQPQGSSSTLTIDGLAGCAEGHMALTGSTTGTLSVDGHTVDSVSGRPEAFVLSFSLGGRAEWLLDLGDAWAAPHRALACDGSGNLIVARTGRWRAGLAPHQRFDLVKVEARDGRVLWSRSLPEELNVASVAAITWDGAAGSILVAGSSSSISAFDGVPVKARGRDMVFAVLSPGGALRWIRTFGGGAPGDGTFGSHPVLPGAGPSRQYRDDDTVLDAAVSAAGTIGFVAAFSYELAFGSTTYSRHVDDQLMVGIITQGGVPGWSAVLGDALPDETAQVRFSGDQLLLLRHGQLSSFSNGARSWTVQAVTPAGTTGSPTVLDVSSRGLIVVAGPLAGDAVAPGRPAESHNMFVTGLRLDGGVERVTTLVAHPHSVPRFMASAGDGQVALASTVQFPGSVGTSTTLATILVNHVN